MLDTNAQRTQMTYQQVRAWSALPDAVLTVFERLSREVFVPETHRRVAYADMPIPLTHGQHMLRPSVVGRILHAVAPKPADQVLEIGTGSGYLTACLALLSAQVQSIEIYDDIARRARSHLRAAGIGNAEVTEADAFALADSAPRYDIIVLTGSMPVYNARFESQLRPGGRLFVIVGEEPVMDARMITLADGTRQSLSLFETVCDPLANAPSAEQFSF
jgi:protein-L-isoaspartate(D-aspartate) O-methyltransferase